LLAGDIMNEQIKQRITQLNNGEVPNDYKKTEFGVFPCDWVTDKKLKDLGSFGKGKGLPGDKMVSEGVPCVGYGDIYMKYNHFHFAEAKTFVDEETASESQPIQNGTLLFTGTGETAEEIGKCVCYNGDETIYAGGDIITFVSDEVEPLFLAYQQYQDFSLRKKASFGQGHSVVHIQKDNLEKLNVAYPKSTEEQSKIAEILMKWDEAIELQEKQLDNLKVKKDAVLQRLIKKDYSWLKISLRNILKERTEFATKDEGYPHVTLSKSGVAKKTEQYNRDFLVKSEDKKYKITRHNDICYNPANLKFGVICINKLTEESIFSPIYITYEVDPKYNVDFIGAVLCSTDFIRYIRKYEEGTVYERQAVKSSDFLRGEIWVPATKGEQDKIASIIKKIDDYIEIEQQKYEALCTQRKALQQYLLNGIVRVNK
jgi:type I restriction enzyme S subunit